MPDDELDEELAEPPRREWTGAHRFRTPVLALAGAGVIAAGVVTLAGGDDHLRPAPSTTPTTRTTTVVAGDPFARKQVVIPAGDDTVDVPRAADRLGLCPSYAICDVNYILPTAALASLRAHFPGATVARSSTLLVRGESGRELNGRIIDARARQLHILVEIRRQSPTDFDVAVVLSSRSQVVGSVRTMSGGYTVIVYVEAPARTSLSLEPLQQLAGDRRLLT